MLTSRPALPLACSPPSRAQALLRATAGRRRRSCGRRCCRCMLTRWAAAPCECTHGLTPSGRLAGAAYAPHACMHAWWEAAHALLWTCKPAHAGPCACLSLLPFTSHAHLCSGLQVAKDEELRTVRATEEVMSRQRRAELRRAERRARDAAEARRSGASAGASVGAITCAPEAPQAAAATVTAAATTTEAAASGAAPEEEGPGAWLKRAQLQLRRNRERSAQLAAAIEAQVRRGWASWLGTAALRSARRARWRPPPAAPSARGPFPTPAAASRAHCHPGPRQTVLPPPRPQAGQLQALASDLAAARSASRAAAAASDQAAAAAELRARAVEARVAELEAMLAAARDQAERAAGGEEGPRGRCGRAAQSARRSAAARGARPREAPGLRRAPLCFTARAARAAGPPLHCAPRSRK
jgi:hypothetical protein